MSSIREFRESPWEQGIDEERYYTLDTAPWGGSPAWVEVALFDGDYDDVSEVKLSGDVVVSGDMITTPLVRCLAAGSTYRLEIKFVVDGRTEEAYGYIYCAR